MNDLGGLKFLYRKRILLLAYPSMRRRWCSSFMPTRSLFKQSQALGRNVFPLRRRTLIVRIKTTQLPRMSSMASLLSLSESTGPARDGWGGCGRREITILSDHDRHGSLDESSAPSVDFGNTEQIYRQKTSLELARGLLVMQLCSFGWFVDNGLKLMNLGMTVLGETLFTGLMRASFYGQFAASPQTVRLVARKFVDAAIAPMLANTAEEEVGENPKHITEERYNRNLDTMLQCLDMQVEVARPDQPILSQLKMTSYIKADVLVKLSEALRALEYNFSTDNPVSIDNLRNGLHGDLVPIPELAEAEMAHLKLALERLDTIMQRALHYNVKILVDAEYVSTNPAISLITFAMMKKYNRTQPNVWNTYQCYLKSAMRNLKRGLAVADAEGFQFGVKVVRGAYMDFERHEARAECRADPVNPTYESTNEMYDNLVAHLMDLMHQRGSNKLGIIIATHNVESVQAAIRRMWELHLPPAEGGVVFGQLMGMCDHVSYGLGQSGYLTYKSVPFGPCKDVLANMSRRAVENKTVFHRLQQEKQMLRQELAHRTLRWQR